MVTDKYKVLLVDDSPDDRFFIQRVLERSPRFVIVGEACDGQEAIDYLQGHSEFPDIVLLDLKMPRKNGFDVLQWLQVANFEKLTVVIMSGSELAEDVTQSLALGAHAYFKKTSSKEDQEKMIFDIEKLLDERKNT
jgi:DNA-binding NarL/FixJ family response regulator